jgi:hypothetical protein
MAVYDETWKEAMNLWFESFIAFFFPHVHRDIDWNRGWESLDNELQQVTRDADMGDKRVDKLVKVWLRDGAEAWLLIHIEIQSQREAGFERRMFVYHYRIFDRYNRQVVSLAVLGDANRHWLPQAFGYEKWGCELSFRFPIVKLLDFTDVEPMLETSLDPIAAMVQAHLATLEEPNDGMSLFVRERRIIRSLYERGMPKQTILELFRVIHGMIDLPEALEQQFIQEHYQWEEEKNMPIVLPFEIRAMEKGKAEGKAEGLREGLLEAIELGLKLRFGAEGLQCLPAVQQLADIEALRRVKQAIETAATLDEFRQKMQAS